MSSSVPPVRNCWPPMAWRAPLMASGSPLATCPRHRFGDVAHPRGSTTRLTAVWLSAEWVSLTQSGPASLANRTSDVCMGPKLAHPGATKQYPETGYRIAIPRVPAPDGDNSGRIARHGRHQSNHPRAEARAAFARHHLRHAREAHLAQRTLGQAHPVARLAVPAAAGAHLRSHRHLAGGADPAGVVGAGGDVQHADRGAGIRAGRGSAVVSLLLP